MSARKLSPILIILASCGAPSRPHVMNSVASPMPVLAAVAGADRHDDVTRGPPPDGAAIDRRSAGVQRVLIRDADLAFEISTDDQQRALTTRVSETATQLGGYVASESEYSVVLRVPSARIDEALGALSELGTVTRRSVRVHEVTAQHTDLAIRIENARKLRARLQSLLEQAKDVKEMLEVEKELGRVTQELELLEGQMRVLEDRVSLSTITVTFERAVSPGPVGWVFYGLYHGVKWLFVWD